MKLEIHLEYLEVLVAKEVVVMSGQEEVVASLHLEVKEVAPHWEEVVALVHSKEEAEELVLIHFELVFWFLHILS